MTDFNHERAILIQKREERARGWRLSVVLDSSVVV